ncbi:MAG: GIN domain-containing protein [Lishizhenia sp.]
MKNLFTLCTVLFSCFTFAATKQLGTFNELIVNSRIHVELIHSENYSVEIEENPEINLDKLSFKYKGNILTINYTGNLVQGLPVKLKLHCSNLLSLKANSGSEIKMDKSFQTSGNRIRFTAFAGGKLDVRSNCKYTVVEVKQGGSAAVEGSTESLTAKVTTGGVIATRFLKANDVTAEISFGGEIICSAIETIDAKVTSGGRISYLGNPSVNKKIVLGGTIEAL